jgi:hypothetical protein
MNSILINEIITEALACREDLLHSLYCASSEISAYSFMTLDKAVNHHLNQGLHLDAMVGQPLKDRILKLVNTINDLVNDFNKTSKGKSEIFIIVVDTRSIVIMIARTLTIENLKIKIDDRYMDLSNKLYLYSLTNMIASRRLDDSDDNEDMYDIYNHIKEDL